MEVLEKVVNKARDCHVEACISTEESENLIFESNKFDSANIGKRIKLEVRVTKGLRSAYAWTNNLSNWKDCVLRAKKLMLASSELKKQPLISKAPKKNKSFIHSSISKASPSLLKSKGEEIINAVNEFKINVPELVITKSLSKEQFLNSNLTSYDQEQSGIIIEIECASGNTSCTDTRTSQGLNIDFRKIGKINGELCKNSLNPKKFRPGLFDIVFDYSAISGLIQILIPSFMANNIIEHKSFFEGRLGKKVASPLLTIKDLGVLPNGVNNKVMDSEGTPVKDKALISKGILKSFLNDLYTASRMNVRPSGNSAGLLKRGFISSNNLVIEPGTATKSELLKDCIYVHDLMGMHTANTVSGDFALSALNAFEYKNKKRPLRDVMISGNIFELLKKATLIGKESRFEAGLKTPMIRFENVQVVG